MSKQGLTYGMAFFFLISFALLGLIVVHEKKEEILLPKIEKKLKNYIHEEYKNLEKEITIEKPVYDKSNDSIQVKVTNKNNKNLYFIVKYRQKKITSTYKKDYLEGKTLLNYLEKKMRKEINLPNIEVIIPNPLDKFSNEVKMRLLKEEDLLALKIYTINYEQKTEDFNSTTILKGLNELEQKLTEKNITPKNYTITITNQQDITQAVRIQNLILPNENLTEIIQAILNNDKQIETKYNIKYKYLN